MQELNRQMMALPELRELEEIIRFGTGPAAVSGVSGVHRAMLGAALRQENVNSVLGDPSPSSAPTSRRRGAWPQISPP